ncbi:phosphotransferase enzyme family protein [Bacillus sp. CGMCC 1.16607]|uniref:phosphotransferase enzyme family protein n=1 Tax=Bacillus sp. CGMCC 1.16607 TaxID=3351842 RepID=UPI00362E4EEE
MLKSIEELYSKEILNEVFARYGIQENDANFLGGFDSYVYEYKNDRNNLILKVTHSFRRTKEEVMDEINWLQYLKENKVSVSGVLPSINGNLVEVYPLGEGNYFLSTLYEKALGTSPTIEDWNEKLFEEWGQITGRLHSLAIDYKPLQWSRKNWLDEEYLNVEKYILNDQEIVREKSLNLVKKMKELPKNKNQFGIVHGDLHYMNFFLNQGEIQLFDFDDIHYNFFINDLAVIIFYAYWRPLSEYKNENEFEKMLLHFFKGYLKEKTMDKELFLLLPEFLKVRHLILYIAALQEIDPMSQSEEEGKFLVGLKEVIEKDYPIVALNFEEFWHNHIEVEIKK